MSRPLRLVALSTALVLAGTVVPVDAFAASTDKPAGAISGTTGAEARTSAPPRPAGVPAAWSASSAAAAPVLRTAGTPTTRAEQRTDARAVSKKWPVRQRIGQATYHPGPASGDPSQNFAGVTMVQDRLYGSMTVTAIMRGVPTASTDSRLRVGFGTARNGVCTPGPGSTDLDRHTYGTNTAIYSGTRIRYAVRLPGAKRGNYNCSFAIILSPDGATVYDAVTDAQLVERRQKPILNFRFKGKRLKPRGFTRVPIRIVNSKYTVATAYRVRLRIKTRGVAVRYRPRVGTIKPGQGKRGAIFVKDTRRGKGWVILTVRSKDYRHTIRVPVREVRR